MRNFLLTAILLAFSFNAFALDSCRSGAWVDPAYEATGIDLQVGEDFIVLFRYDYLNGDANYWVGVAVNDDSGSYDFAVSSTRMLDDGSIEDRDVGTFSLDEAEDGSLLFSWSFSLDLGVRDASIPWCLGGDCRGSRVLAPLFLSSSCE